MKSVLKRAAALDGEIPHHPDMADAKWIGIWRDPAAGVQPCPYLRRSFTIEGVARRATLTWTALGLAEVEINGRPVGDCKLAPGWTDYRHRTQAISFDVTGLLRPGENVIGAVLGDGWFCGHLLWNNARNHYGTAPSFLGALTIETDQNELVRIATDEAWKAATGPEQMADIYHGERYDAREEIGHWSSPGYDDESWRSADLFPAYTGSIDPKRCPPVRVTEEIEPVSISPLPDGRFVVDFGQNMAGVCRLKVMGRTGQVITLRFAEMLQNDGTLYRDNLRTAEATDIYTCRGGGPETWTPRFTFHGFRYVEITGLDQAPQRDCLTALVLHTDMAPAGTFRCSSEDINQLDRNIRWGQRSNFLDVPTDCPQRDERLGWTGDAQVFIETAAFHYDVRTFFEKWMTDVVDGQREDGAFPDVAPDLLHQHGNAAWGDAGVICPWLSYWIYGDDTILRENYEAMKRWIDFQESTSRDLVRPRTAYGDWLAIDAVMPDQAPVPSDLVGTAYFAHTTDLMSRVAEVLGKTDDAGRFTRLHGEVVGAFQREFVSPSGRVVGDCQTGYLLALAFDLLPPPQRARAFDELVGLIEKRDWHLSTGFVGTPLLCPVLSRFGRTDIAYRLLLQDTYPSWLYPIRNGATTMWERWNSYTHERGFGPVAMNSFNHYAYGAVGAWIYEVVGGIRALEPGFKRILFAPQPGGSIEWARTTRRTPHGEAACEWRLESDVLSMKITVPPGVIGEVRVPEGFEVVEGDVAGEYAPGQHRFEAARPCK